MTLRIAFAGTPAFAVPTLSRLIESEHHVVAVITQPDRRQGRGQKIRFSPVKEFADAHGLMVFQPDQLTGDAVGFVRDVAPDLIVVVAYGLIIPVQMLAIARLGCINVHASLLPRWRGAAPIARAIEAGDRQTGITIMQMDEGLDTGAIYSQRLVPIDEHCTAETLQQQLSELGAKHLVEILPQIESNTLIAKSQDHSKATYAHKLTAQEAQIDWKASAKEVIRKVRAYNPRPVAYTWMAEQRLRIFKARDVTCNQYYGKPGQIVRADRKCVYVMTGDGVVSLEVVQKQGKAKMHIDQFVAGNPIAEGSLLTFR